MKRIDFKFKIRTAVAAILAVITLLPVACKEEKEPEIRVSGVMLDKTNLSLTVGDEATLKATVTPANAANSGVDWSTDAPAVATVSGGKVTAVKAGTATITVTTLDGGKTAGCVVTVVEAVVPLVVADDAKYDIPAMVVGTKITDIDLSGAVSGGKAPCTFTAAGLPAGITVSTAGIISGTPTTAAAEGTATITVTDSSLPAQTGTITIACGTVSIPDPIFVAVTGITDVPSAASVGTPLALGGTVVPSDATNKTITWSVKSAGSTGATVSEGTLTATAAGTATLTSTVANGKTASTDYTQDFEIIITTVTIPVTGVSLNKTAMSLTVGGTETLTATIAPANATNKNVTWSSDAAAIAAVDASGKVTPMSAGTATITVTTADGNKTAECTVTVTAATVPVTGVSLNKTAMSLTVGGTETLTATIAPANATNKNVTWSSNAAAIAAVDASGKVTVMSAGTATITVTTVDGNKTAECTVTVTAPPSGGDNINIDDGEADEEW
ncbi:MAG: Ig-like domain-containing protein [Tannerellaceae bacterium]|jgi:uncharacterized protein YjdB|nr:Ig-like domain-containing protein [Tannerellaceae bacterium]